jgi:hypothetical protein
MDKVYELNNPKEVEVFLRKMQLEKLDPTEEKITAR